MKISFVKFAGCAAGGTEKYLQSIAILVKKAGHEVDYYYTNAAPITSTSWVHPDNDPLCIKLLEDNGINLIKVNVGFRHHNTWHNTDFFEKFDVPIWCLLLPKVVPGPKHGVLRSMVNCIFAKLLKIL